MLFADAFANTVTYVNLYAFDVETGKLVASYSEEGDALADFVGPLGNPTELEGLKRVAIVGGGVGCAIALPSAQAFKEAGAEVTVIVGFRSKDIVILEDEFKACADRLILCCVGSFSPPKKKFLRLL